MSIQLPAAALIGAGSREGAFGPLSKPTPALKNESFHHTLNELTAKPEEDSPEKVASVAKQFEALMIGQVLKAARASSDGGWLDDGDDQTNEMTLEIAEQSLSEAMASRGTFGIAKLVTTTVERRDSTAASSEPATPHRSQPSMGSTP